MSELLQVSNEVADALASARPVVALETSIVGQGLPHPYNLRAARDCEAAIREEGAVPATVGVLDGRLCVGLTDVQLQRIASGAIKVSSRDLGWTLVRGEVGATTVAATMRVAAMAGIKFFATGGIGGVHRGHPEDESADLVELSRTEVAVFCAGAKIILDLRLTLERLESLAVPVLGYAAMNFLLSTPRTAASPWARESTDRSRRRASCVRRGRRARVVWLWPCPRPPSSTMRRSWCSARSASSRT